MTKNISTVTAIPCGKLRDGSPLPRAEFAIVRSPEPFGAGKSRLWGTCAASARHGLVRVAPLAVVWTDSIEQAPGTDQPIMAFDGRQAA